LCVCLCVCVLCQAHQLICISFDGKTPDIFKTKASSKICSHMVRSDRSLSLFYSLLQVKCRDRSPTSGTKLTVILLETFFLFLIKDYCQKCGTCRINTVNSHINRGMKCTKYLKICIYYNYVHLTFHIFYIYKSTTFSAQFCPLYIPR